MSYAHEPDLMLPEFLAIIQPRLDELNLDNDAVALVHSYIRHGSSPAARLSEDERRAFIDDAVRKLDDVSRAVSAELFRYGGGPVSRDMLAAVLQSHCGVPPFCYGERGGDAATSEVGSGSGSSQELGVH
jgi:hypothetical protein